MGPGHLAHPRQAMLDNCAAWIDEECAHFGIPKVRLTAAQAQAGGTGVCGHVDLGSAGGGHWDPGPDFPWDVVLSGTTPPGTPAPTPPAAAGTAPPWPGVYLSDYTEHPSARTWQTQMASRGWDIVADGMYGPASADVCRTFQAEKGLVPVDGVVGPDTWAAAWTAPVT